MESRNLYSSIGEFAKIYDFLLNIGGYKKSVDSLISQLSFSQEDKLLVLDAGCGSGLYSLSILKRFKNAEVYAFDLDEKLVSHLNQKISNLKISGRAHIFTGDITAQLPEVDGRRFDLIITAGVLEYVSLEEAVKNLSRYLNNQGYILCSPVRNSAWGKFVCKIYKCSPYAKELIINTFEKNGFVLEKTLRISKHPAASFKDAYLFRKK